MNAKSTGSSKSGFALIIVMSIIATMSAFLGILIFSSSQQAHMAKRLTQKIKARAQAEAGCEYGYAILQQDWDARNDPDAFDPLPNGSVP